MPQPEAPARSTVDHRIAAADGGHCVLVEVAPLGLPTAEVVLVPGMFTARGFWLSRKGIGLAAHLADAGMRCWILERRGMGAAAGQAECRLGLNEAERHDLPAAWAYVRQRSDAPAFIVGHSFGGVLAARALAGSLPPRACAGLVLFAAQCEVAKAPLHPPGSWLTGAIVALLGRLPARVAGLGPEDEPAAAIRDAIAWTTSARRDGEWLAGLAGLPVPQLAMAGAADRVDPPDGCGRFARRLAGTDARFELLGRAGGWGEDYDHAGMVVSTTARAEVWPFVAHWLARQAARRPTPPTS